MGKTRITIRRICPACDGRGKSYGARYCGACKGRHKVRETITIEDVGDAAPAHDSAANIAAATKKVLREMGIDTEGDDR